MVKLTSSTWTRPLLVGDRKAGDHERVLAERRRLLVTVSSTGRPTMSEASSALLAVGLGLADDLAAADHGDPVGDLADLAELVGDEDDGGPALAELAHGLHQLVGLLGRQDGGRLVEDQDPGIAGERLDDLDALLDAHGEVLDDGIGVDIRSRTAPRSRGPRSRAASEVEEPAKPVCSLPSITFSATVNTGTSMKCWCTMPMPAAMASPGLAKRMTSPSTRISPSSAW